MSHKVSKVFPCSSRAKDVCALNIGYIFEEVLDK